MGLDHGRLDAVDEYELVSTCAYRLSIRKNTHAWLVMMILRRRCFGSSPLTTNSPLSIIHSNRFCSSDIPAPTALYNSATGAGTQEIIYFNGEETAGGRVMGTVVSGPDAGTAFHLAHFGYYAVENVVLSPAEQDLTVAMGMDDSSNGEVYVYVGTKTTVGNDVTKAGLVNGTLYALAVPGKPYEVDDIVALNLMATERFVLKLIGEPGNYPQDGLETTANGLNTTFDPAQPGVEALKFAGPEDGSWDPRVGFQNVFYFVSKGSTVNGRPALSRIWRCTFDDIANPVAGGTLEMVNINIIFLGLPQMIKNSDVSTFRMSCTHFVFRFFLL